MREDSKLEEDLSNIKWDIIELTEIRRKDYNWIQGKHDIMVAKRAEVSFIISNKIREHMKTIRD